MYASVIVPLHLPPLTYRVPSGLVLSPGQPVLVRVRKKELSGIVLDLLEELPAKPAYEIRELEGPSEEMPTLGAENLRLFRWAADYYHHPMGEVLRAFLPPNPRPPVATRFRLTLGGAQRLAQGELPRGNVQKALVEKMHNSATLEAESSERASLLKLIAAGWVEKFFISEEAKPETQSTFSSPPPLTKSQGEAVARITDSLSKNAFQTFLLQGITGSGKTEVYLRAAEHTLRHGRSVLIVVPEIALTPQLLSRFNARFGNGIALLHSGMADGERSRQWHLLNQGKLRICLGARSAALAPVQNIGLVVVDEEHDSALKQDDHLKYNARDLAIVRAKHSSATVVLGSATPSLESFHNSTTGRYQHLILNERPGGQPLPAVQVVDQTKREGNDSITPYLKHSIDEAIAQGGQVMLLLNRRGFSSFLLCEGCGYVPECPNCSVSLTNYLGSRQLKCHYCGYSSASPKICQRCSAHELKPGTLGTEALEEEAVRLFPKARVLRIDRESTERKGSLERALSAIAQGEVDIVIGTQIIAKGHDFPNISLVGVVNADSSFHLPDFRASEKSFQLFTQMAGRAGRGDRPGRVLIQTYDPQHASIRHATNHDFRSFAEEELRFRLEFHYPPFTRLARLLITAPSSAEAEEAGGKLSALLNAVAVSPKVDIVGPAPAVLAKVQNRYRWNILLKSAHAKPLHTLIGLALREEKRLFSPKTSLQVDVDPVSLM